MKDFVLDKIDILNEHINVKELVDGSNHSISVSIFENILFNDKTYNKLIKYLKNNKIYEFRIFYNLNVLLKASKISFLESCLLYLKKYGYENTNKYNELSYILNTLNFVNYIDMNNKYNIIIDNEDYSIKTYYFYEF